MDPDIQVGDVYQLNGSIRDGQFVTVRYEDGDGQFVTVRWVEGHYFIVRFSYLPGLWTYTANDIKRFIDGRTWRKVR
jgi:hypothetical protein